VRSGKGLGSDGFRDAGFRELVTGPDYLFAVKCVNSWESFLNDLTESREITIQLDLQLVFNRELQIRVGPKN
jgi:hypothetical protein